MREQIYSVASLHRTDDGYEQLAKYCVAAAQLKFDLKIRNYPSSVGILLLVKNEIEGALLAAKLKAKIE